MRVTASFNHVGRLNLIGQPNLIGQYEKEIPARKEKKYLLGSYYAQCFF